jgi:hypothetical protein
VLEIIPRQGIGDSQAACPRQAEPTTPEEAVSQCRVRPSQ